MRFTGEPAYFKHVGSAAEHIMAEMQLTPADFTHAIFHQPNAKFPKAIGARLGFKPEQIQTGLLSPEIGNTYAGAALIGLSAVLDIAQPGDRILMVSYGSGAGSDAVVLTVTSAIEQRRSKALTTRQYIARREEVDYATYARMRGKITME